MRHNKKFNHLSRTSAHRRAMLSNMATSLIMHKRIKTTLAKAKALRLFVEPIITKAKDDSDHSRRMVFAKLQNKEVIKELFGVVREKVGERPGGYTRILRTGFRLGDNAEMCMIELVDFNENLLGTKEKKSAAAPKKTRRSRRGGAKKTEENIAATAETASSKEEKKVASAKNETAEDKTKQQNKKDEKTPEA